MLSLIFDFSLSKESNFRLFCAVLVQIFQVLSI